VTVAAMRMAESLLNPILGESNFSRDDFDIESKVFYDPWPANPKHPDQVQLLKLFSDLISASMKNV
jgi:aryl-alcohol dehydrogenase-like predicted oxidoreductase